MERRRALVEVNLDDLHSYLGLAPNVLIESVAFDPKHRRVELYLSGENENLYRYQPGFHVGPRSLEELQHPEPSITVNIVNVHPRTRVAINTGER